MSTKHMATVGWVVKSPKNERQACMGEQKRLCRRGRTDREEKKNPTKRKENFTKSEFGRD